MLKPMRDRWSAHARVILPLLALATLTLVTCRTTLSPVPVAPAAGGSWAKQNLVSVLTWMSKSVDRCNSGLPSRTCKMKVLLQLLLDWCNVQFKIGALQESRSFAVQSWCFLMSNCALAVHAFICLRAPWGTRLTSQLKTHASNVLVSGWVKTVEAFRHAFAYLVEQKIWLAMRLPSGVDWACLSLCGLCIVCALVVYRLYCKRKLRATLGVQHLPAQASPTLPSKPLGSGKLNSAKLDAETLPDPHKGDEDQQEEVADSVDATANLDKSQMEKASKLSKKQPRAARAAASARKSLGQSDEKSPGQSGELPWQTVTRRRRLPKPSPYPPAEASPVVSTVTSNLDMPGGNCAHSAKPRSERKGRRVAHGDAKQPVRKVATTPKAIRSWVNSQQGSAAPALQPLTVRAVGQSSVYSISNSDVDQEWPLPGAAVSTAQRQAPAQMSRLSSAQASASPEVPAPLATAQAANLEEDSSSHVAADSAVAAGISAEEPALASSSSAASVPAEGVCIGHEDSPIASAPAASGASSVSGMNMVRSGTSSDVSASTVELQPSSPSALLGQPASQAALPGSVFTSSPSIDSPAPSFTFEAVDHHVLSARDRDISVPTCARAAVFGSLPDLRGVHASLFLQQSGYLVTPMLEGTCNFCTC